MNSGAARPAYAPPDRGTFELSVFGAGIGEAVVVHLGNGKWLLVDSCLEPESNEPIAVQYLSQLGVHASAVETIVVTHWHEDHVGGIDRVIAAFPKARIFVPGAFESADLLQLVLAGAETDVVSTGALKTRESLNKSR